MDCLSQEQLAQLALGLEADADLSVHLQQCTNCQVDLVHFQSLNDQLSAAHKNLHCGHSESRQRLLAALPNVDPQSQPARLWQKPPSWLGELNMKQRITLSSLSVVTVLGLIVVWAVVSTKPLSAMEKMRENIREARSCKSKSKLEFGIYDPGRKPASTTLSSTSYWTAPGSSRVELKGKGVLSYIHSTVILPAGKPGIEFVHATTEFRHGPPGASSDYSGVKMLLTLGEHADSAYRSLGTKIIDGRKALGFVIDSKKIDLDSYIGHGYSGLLHVWLDAKTNLPVELRIEMKNAATQENPITAMSASFEWNVELDAELFDTTPPEGYSDNTPRPGMPKTK